MNRSFFALFVAILIHLILLLLYVAIIPLLPKVQKKPNTQEDRIKISLKEIPKKHKKSATIKEKVKPSQIAPAMPKGSQLKKIINKPPIKYEKKEIIKKTKLNPKKVSLKPKQTIKQKTVTTLKPFINLKKITNENNITKEIITKKEKHENPLYALLSQDMSAKEEQTKTTTKSSQNNINQNIKKLYGEEFGKLSSGQQQYILDNQEIMRRITQQVLNRQASVTNLNRLKVNRSNTIEFYLHPNGDMSDFKFLDKSGYFVLDDITKTTIEYAYSKYPRPKEKTLIRYNVFYNLR